MPICRPVDGGALGLTKPGYGGFPGVAEGMASQLTWEIMKQCEAEKAIQKIVCNRNSLYYLCNSPINLKLFLHKKLKSESILLG